MHAPASLPLPLSVSHLAKAVGTYLHLGRRGMCHEGVPYWWNINTSAKPARRPFLLELLLRSSSLAAGALVQTARHANSSAWSGTGFVENHLSKGVSNFNEEAFSNRFQLVGTLQQ